MYIIEIYCAFNAPRSKIQKKTLERMCHELLNSLMTDDERKKLYIEFSKTKNYEQLLSKISLYTSEIKFASTNSSTEKNELESNKLREKGNEYLKCKKYHLALTYYTQSIAKAPFNCLSVAYANRSNVLQLLRLYRECISDIERSINCNYPSDLIYKLKLRQGQCYLELGMSLMAKKMFSEAKELIQKADISEDLRRKLREDVEGYKATKQAPSCNAVSSDPPDLCGHVNSELPALSSYVELKYSPERGRHLIATCDIQPGDVLCVESAYSAILLPEHHFTHCSHCFVRCHALLPCLNCTWALYCSDCCQTLAYQTYHKLECQAMTTIRTLNLSNFTPAHLAIRTLALTGLTRTLQYHRKNLTEPMYNQRTRGFNSDGKFLTNNFGVIYHQCTNNKYSIELLIARVLLADCIVKILQYDQHPSSREITGLILHLMSVHSINCHDIYERFSTSETYSKDVCIGNGVYPTVGLINHSCDQNVVRHYHGKTVVVRAIRAIRKGEEILDTYGPHFIADFKSFRQEILRDHQCFECRCEACVNDWPTQASLPWTMPGSKVSKQVNDAIVKYVKNKTVVFKNVPSLCKYLRELDSLNQRLTQEYFVIQEIIKVSYALKANFYCCRDDIK